MKLPKPYFMENLSWYYYDENEGKYILTDKAPKKAVDSYNKFYEELDGSNKIYD